MTNLPERFLHRARRVGALLCLLVLGACGPGGGGTGTGPTAYFSYAGVATSAPGTGDACTTGCGRIDLELDADRVALDTGCGRFTATGPWSPDAAGDVFLPGRFAPIRGGEAVEATLRLQFPDAPAASTTVRVTLLDAAGAVQLGPLDVVKLPGVPTPAADACPR